MADRPILFSAPMVKALLAGTKTQTRRGLSIKGHKSFSQFGPSDTKGYDWHFRDEEMRWHDLRHAELLARLRWQVGDRLWVKETWRVGYGTDGYRDDLGRCPKPSEYDPKTTEVEYLADGERELGGPTHPSIFMCRWASRLTLTVTDVRIERLQDISQADAFAEGVGRIELPDNVPFPPGILSNNSYKLGYWQIWNEINGPEAWEENPWVVAVSFICEQRNIDG